VSRRVHLAPLAIASDGTIFVNVAMFDTPKDLAALLETAQRERGALFIGVVLGPTEADAVRETLRHAHREAAAVVVGPREARRRK
jgi:hypothetical protein